VATIETSIRIDRPVDDVYPFVVDVENCPRWRTSCLGAKRLTQGPLGAGTRETYRMKALGRAFEVTVEVTGFERNLRYSWKAVSGSPFPMQGSFSFEAVDGDTRVTETADVTTDGLLRLMRPLVVRMWRRQVTADFTNLKRALEANTAGTS